MHHVMTIKPFNGGDFKYRILCTCGAWWWTPNLQGLDNLDHREG